MTGLSSIFSRGAPATEGTAHSPLGKGFLPAWVAEAAWAGAARDNTRAAARAPRTTGDSFLG